MGASSWEYYVPYQPDISVALQKLCESGYREHHRTATCVVTGKY